MALPSSEGTSCPESQVSSLSEPQVGHEQHDGSRLPEDPQAASGGPAADGGRLAVSPPLSNSSSFESSGSVLSGAFLSRSLSSDLYDAAFAVEEEDDDLLRKMHSALQDDEDSASSANAAAAVSSSMGLHMEPGLGASSSLSVGASSLSPDFLTSSFSSSSSSSLAVSGLSSCSVTASSPLFSSQRQPSLDAGKPVPAERKEEVASLDSGTQPGGSPAVHTPVPGGPTPPSRRLLLGSPHTDDASAGSALGAAEPRLDLLVFSGTSTGDSLFPHSPLPPPGPAPVQKEADRTENIVGMGLAALHKALAKKAQEAAAKAREEGSESGAGAALPTQHEDLCKITPLSVCFLKAEEHETKDEGPSDSADAAAEKNKGNEPAEAERPVEREAREGDAEALTEETREREESEAPDSNSVEPSTDERLSGALLSSLVADVKEEEKTDAERSAVSGAGDKAIGGVKTDARDDGDLLPPSKENASSCVPSLCLSRAVETEGDSEREAAGSPDGGAPLSSRFPCSSSPAPPGSSPLEKEVSPSGDCLLVADPQLFRLLRALEQTGAQVEEELRAEERRFAETASLLLRDLDLETQAAVSLSSRSPRRSLSRARRDRGPEAASGEEDSEGVGAEKTREAEDAEEEEMDDWENSETGRPSGDKAGDGSFAVDQTAKNGPLASFRGTSMSSVLPLRVLRQGRRQSRRLRARAASSVLRRRLEQKIRRVRETLLAAVGAAEEDIGMLEKEFQNVAECEISPFARLTLSSRTLHAPFPPTASPKEFGLAPYFLPPASAGLPPAVDALSEDSRALFALPGVCGPDRGDGAWLPPSAWSASFGDAPLTLAVSESVASSLPSSPLASGGAVGQDEDQGDSSGDACSAQIPPARPSRPRAASHLTLLLPSVTSDSSATCPIEFDFEACPSTPERGASGGFLGRPADSGGPPRGAEQSDLLGDGEETETGVPETPQEGAERTHALTGDGAEVGVAGHVVRGPAEDGTDTNEDGEPEGDVDSRMSLGDESGTFSLSSAFSVGAGGEGLLLDSGKDGKRARTQTLGGLPATGRQGDAASAVDSSPSLAPGETDSEEALSVLPSSAADEAQGDGDLRGASAHALSSAMGGQPIPGAAERFSTVSSAWGSSGNAFFLEASAGEGAGDAQLANEKGEIFPGACSGRGALPKGKSLAGPGQRTAGGGKKRGGRAATGRGGSDWVEAERAAKQQRLPLELFSMATRHVHEEACLRAAASFWERTKRRADCFLTSTERALPGRPCGAGTHEGTVALSAGASGFSPPAPPALPALFLAAQHLQPAVGPDGLRRGPWLSHGEDISTGIRATNRRRALVSLLQFLREISQVAVVQVREPLSRQDASALASAVAAATAVACAGASSPRTAGGGEGGAGGSCEDEGLDSRELGEEGAAESVGEEDRKGGRSLSSHTDGFPGSKTPRTGPPFSSSSERREFSSQAFAASCLSPFAALPQSPAIWFDPPVPATVWGGETASGVSAGWLGSNSAASSLSAVERECRGLGKGGDPRGPAAQKSGPAGPSGGAALAPGTDEDEGGKTEEEKRWASLPGFGGGSVERVVLCVRRDCLPVGWLREMPFECRLKLDVETRDDERAEATECAGANEEATGALNRGGSRDAGQGSSGSKRSSPEAASQPSEAAPGVRASEGKEDVLRDSQGAPSASENPPADSLQGPVVSSAALVRNKPPFLAPRVSAPPSPPRCRIPKCTCCVEVADSSSAFRACSAAACASPSVGASSFDDETKKRKRASEGGAVADEASTETREDEKRRRTESGEDYFVMEDALKLLSRARQDQQEALLRFQRQALELCDKCWHAEKSDEEASPSDRGASSPSGRDPSRCAPSEKSQDGPSSRRPAASRAAGASLRQWRASLRALGLSVPDVVQAISIAERERRWASTPARRLHLSVESLVRDRSKEEYVELAFFLPHKPSTVEPWQVALELSEEEAAARSVEAEAEPARPAPSPSDKEESGEKGEFAAAPATPNGPLSSKEAEREAVEGKGRGGAHGVAGSDAKEKKGDEEKRGLTGMHARAEGPDGAGKGGRGRTGRGGRGGKGASKCTGKRRERDDKSEEREDKSTVGSPACSDKSPSASCEAPEGADAHRGSLSLLAAVETCEGGEEKNSRQDFGEAWAGVGGERRRAIEPEGVSRVWRVVAQRKVKMQNLLRQQKRLCRALFKPWRKERLALERARIREGDVFSWGILPVRAVDHPDQLVSLPAGFRTGNRNAPYQRGCEQAESGACEGEDKKASAEGGSGRRSTRGGNPQDASFLPSSASVPSTSAGGTDRQRAKEEAANRESKREWMQANYANLTGPGVFWRDSCLFSLGQGLRQRLERRAEQCAGVFPVDLLEKDLDYAILDLDRAVSYHDRCTLLKDVALVELEKKTSTVWAESEARTFVEKFLMYPKNFEKIASYLDGKSTKDCVDFYYRFKYQFGLKRRLQELEDTARSKKKNRLLGSKQLRREELVAELFAPSVQAMARLEAECCTEPMRLFNAQNSLPFDVFSGYLLHQRSVWNVLKDPVGTRPADEAHDSDLEVDARGQPAQELFLENLREGYFFPSTYSGFVPPGRVANVPAWFSPTPQPRCKGASGFPPRSAKAATPPAAPHVPLACVPGCFFIERPAKDGAPGAAEKEAASRVFSNAQSPFAPSLAFSYRQLNTLLTCLQAAAQRGRGGDDEGPSYMTRSRSGRNNSKPASCGAKPPVSGASAAQASGHASADRAGWQSPRARALDALLLRLRGVLRGKQTGLWSVHRKRQVWGPQTEKPAASSPSLQAADKALAGRRGRGAAAPGPGSVARDDRALATLNGEAVDGDVPAGEATRGGFSRDAASGPRIGAAMIQGRSGGVPLQRMGTVERQDALVLVGGDGGVGRGGIKRLLTEESSVLSSEDGEGRERDERERKRHQAASVGQALLGEAAEGKKEGEAPATQMASRQGVWEGDGEDSRKKDVAALPTQKKPDLAAAGRATGPSNPALLPPLTAKQKEALLAFLEPRAGSSLPANVAAALAASPLLPLLAGGEGHRPPFPLLPSSAAGLPLPASSSQLLSSLLASSSLSPLFSLAASLGPNSAADAGKSSAQPGAAPQRTPTVVRPQSLLETLSASLSKAAAPSASSFSTPASSPPRASPKRSPGLSSALAPQSASSANPSLSLLASLSASPSSSASSPLFPAVSSAPSPPLLPALSAQTPPVFPPLSAAPSPEASASRGTARPSPAASPSLAALAFSKALPSAAAADLKEDTVSAKPAGSPLSGPLGAAARSLLAPGNAHSDMLRSLAAVAASGLVREAKGEGLASLAKRASQADKGRREEDSPGAGLPGARNGPSSGQTPSGSTSCAPAGQSGGEAGGAAGTALSGNIQASNSSFPVLPSSAIGLLVQAAAAARAAAAAKAAMSAPGVRAVPGATSVMASPALLPASLPQHLASSRLLPGLVSQPLSALPAGRGGRPDSGRATPSAEASPVLAPLPVSLSALGAALPSGVRREGGKDEAAKTGDNAEPASAASSPFLAPAALARNEASSLLASAATRVGPGQGLASRSAPGPGASAVASLLANLAASPAPSPSPASRSPDLAARGQPTVPSPVVAPAPPPLPALSPVSAGNPPALLAACAAAVAAGKLPAPVALAAAAAAKKAGQAASAAVPGASDGSPLVLPTNQTQGANAAGSLATPSAAARSVSPSPLQRPNVGDQALSGAGLQSAEACRTRSTEATARSPTPVAEPAERDGGPSEPVLGAPDGSGSLRANSSEVPEARMSATTPLLSALAAGLAASVCTASSGAASEEASGLGVSSRDIEGGRISPETVREETEPVSATSLPFPGSAPSADPLDAAEQTPEVSTLRGPSTTDLPVVPRAEGVQEREETRGDTGEGAAQCEGEARREEKSEESGTRICNLEGEAEAVAQKNLAETKSASLSSAFLSTHSSSIDLAFSEAGAEMLLPGAVSPTFAFAASRSAPLPERPLSEAVEEVQASQIARDVGVEGTEGTESSALSDEANERSAAFFVRAAEPTECSDPPQSTQSLEGSAERVSTCLPVSSLPPELASELPQNGEACSRPAEATVSSLPSVAAMSGVWAENREESSVPVFPFSSRVSSSEGNEAEEEGRRGAEDQSADHESEGAQVGDPGVLMGEAHDAFREKDERKEDADPADELSGKTVCARDLPTDGQPRVEARLEEAVLHALCTTGDAGETGAASHCPAVPLDLSRVLPAFSATLQDQVSAVAEGQTTEGEKETATAGSNEDQ
ncbi:putative myb-like DNA-binding domain-containing protein [Neospora caninum Liverpool]|uniref:Myb-like DNA-binding domain-containing protein,putative n=1 Tax=Neospora caninum (strain Liverpool) TaxID=572307 RepID=F0V8D0_NEOCL|nr:putative myb-like DNA-binding domain-containing protein [Neospora caninum Liverpool]CBZ49971.1 putative myb-like DNA-binding domain-containing protein [Neospora caninum Liverpool]CEL64559.1 TPA: myb-like DNA-binding domain-containing protein,putative [Neospora caninum Liverpool]|eukprot:XP_003880006.1 putative myb-like DNA-binding domain-containing protein [Neospora caninum Liverpool]